MNTSPPSSAKPSSVAAKRLERAYDRGARIVALDIPDREARLRVLQDCPEELVELRATLLQEHVWGQREVTLQSLDVILPRGPAAVLRRFDPVQ